MESMRNPGMPQSTEADCPSFKKFELTKYNPGLPSFSIWIAW
jgi:hypothetical protein